MNGIIHWYNTNRKTIWIVIGGFIAIFLMIKLINGMYYDNPSAPIEKQQKEEKLTNTITIDSDESAVSGQDLSKGQKGLLKTLDEFVAYCKDGNIDNAYNLLSKECKQEMYPTKEFFKASYYDKIFDSEDKIVSAENWIGNIYKVKYKEDPLTTGNIDDKNTKQDYITIVEDESGNKKININGYIGREKINVSNKINVTEGNDSLEIKALETNKYMDYQTITFEITNNSNRTVFLNDPKLTSQMYIEDKNGIQYQAYTHEIADSQLEITPSQTKKLTIKYYSRYTSRKEISNIIFGRIVLDYDAYSNYQDVSYYNNYGRLQIKL